MKKKNIPNYLTFLRVLAVPVALGLAIFYPMHPAPLFVVFALASVTDFFDGYLARKWSATSQIGALLDPVADKLLVAVVLLFLVDQTYAPTLAAALIILRELYIAGLREFLGVRNIPLPVSKGGKWKTALQMLSLTLILAGMTFKQPMLWDSGVALLWIASFLAVASAVGYTRSAWPHLRG